MLSHYFDGSTSSPWDKCKDLMGFTIAMMMFLILNLMEPYILGDPDNFIPANPLVTPAHIKPEWYFLFAYAILWSIPNKLGGGGVIALIMSILILLTLPFSNMSKFKAMKFYPVSQMLFWMLVSTTMLLTWIGAGPVEEPYIWTGMNLTYIYFSYFIIEPLSKKLWDNFIN